MFVLSLQADAPRAERIPADNLLGATVVFVSGCYRDNEFLRIGYYVNVDYVDEALAEHPPEPPRIDRYACERETALAAHTAVVLCHVCLISIWNCR